MEENQQDSWIRRVARRIKEFMRNAFYVLLVLLIALIFGPLGWWLLEQAGVPIRKEGK
jgi:hypothetical protein